MIFLYPFFSINKLSITGLNVIIYNQSIAAVSPLVGGGGEGREGGAEGEFKGYYKVLLLTLPCCLAFFVTFPPPPPLFCWCCVDKCLEVGSGLGCYGKNCSSSLSLPSRHLPSRTIDEVF